MKEKYTIKRISVDNLKEIRELYLSIFTKEPMNEDWSDILQLNAYLYDLIGQECSLSYGFYEDKKMIGFSLGRIKHWYTGIEYFIDVSCVKEGKQRQGLGTLFFNKLEETLKELKVVEMFLQTKNNIPAQTFFTKNGYSEIENQLFFSKTIK